MAQKKQKLINYPTPHQAYGEEHRSDKVGHRGDAVIQHRRNPTYESQILYNDPRTKRLREEKKDISASGKATNSLFYVKKVIDAVNIHDSPSNILKMQKVLNSFNKNNDSSVSLKEDGVIGDKTRAAVKAFRENDKKNTRIEDAVIDSMKKSY
jgi:hypothetical protein